MPTPDQRIHGLSIYCLKYFYLTRDSKFQTKDQAEPQQWRKSQLMMLMMLVMLMNPHSDWTRRCALACIHTSAYAPYTALLVQRILPWMASASNRHLNLELSAKPSTSLSPMLYSFL